MKGDFETEDLEMPTVSNTDTDVPSTQNLGLSAQSEIQSNSSGGGLSSNFTDVVTPIFAPLPMKKNMSFEYSFTGSNTHNWDYKSENIDTTEMYNMNCCSQIFFSFINPMIREAHAKPDLKVSDIPSANFLMQEEEQDFWNEYTKRAEAIEPDKEGEVKTDSAVSGAMWHVYGSRLYLGVFLAIADKVIQLIRPQLLGELIDYLYDDNADERNGWIYANAFAVCVLLNAILSRQSALQVSIVTAQGQQTMSKLSFQKVLRLGVETDIDGGVGKIVNICSSDIGAIMGMLQSLPSGLACVLDFIMITYFLYQEVGASAFMIWFTLLLVLCLIGAIAAWLGTLMAENYRLSDMRIKTITEILNGIKLYKLYGWEMLMQSRVENIRADQVAVAKEIFTAFVYIIAMINLSTVMMTLSVFGLYMGLGNELTVRKVMVCLAYFSQFGFSLMGMGFFLQAYIPYFTSRTRLAKFWATKELAKYIESDKKGSIADSSEVVFELRNATLGWRDPERVRKEEEKAAKKKAEEEAAALAEEENKDGEVKKDENGDDVKIDIDDESAAANVEKSEEKKDDLIKSNFKLKGMNIQIRRGELTAIVGSVASGKSSVMAALVGEMYLLEGEVVSKLGESESIAYLPQKHYILNASVRENICMEIAYSDDRYVKAVRNAALIQDINRFDDADKTEIGAKGINISGGQKSRIMIARALYQEADVYFLDDVLSAVDPDVGDEIFNRAIVGAMQHSTRVLVMNSHLHNLKRCDHIVIIDEGEVVAQGKYDELIDEYHALMAPKTANEDRMVHAKKKKVTEKIRIKSAGKETTALIEKEHKEFGKVSIEVYKGFLRNMFPESGWGPKAIFGYLAAIAITTALTSQLGEFYVIFWADFMENDKDFLSLGEISETLRILIWVVLNIIKLFTYALCSRYIIRKCFDSSEVTHNKAFKGTLTAGLEFFDKTPVGRILNRFSGDIQSSDWEIPFAFQSLLNLSSTFIVSFAIIFVVIFYTIPFVIIISYVMYRLTKYYVVSSSSLKRLDAVSNSPVVDLLEECVGNYQVLRVGGYGERYISKYTKRVDASVRAKWSFAIAQQWYSLRLQLITTVLLIAVFNFVVLLKTNSPLSNRTLLAVTLTQSQIIVSIIQWIMEGYINFQNALVSVERLMKQANSDPKDPQFVRDSDPSDEWPSQGAIEFKDVSFKYRDDMPTRLFNFDLSVKAGEKIGICGRSGSGKSTITMSLFRMYDHIDGSILIDGIDTKSLGVTKLRRSIGIIPQDPVVMAGSVKYNLDPYELYSAEQLSKVVSDLELPKHWHCEQEDLLQQKVDEGGENLSAGQKQLICIGRVLLQDKKIVVLDEATANIDAETDDKLQEVMRTFFKEKTVLSIAHRIDTIMDSDRILLLEDGKKLEFDSPQKLLADPNSSFSKFVKGEAEEKARSPSAKNSAAAEI